MSAATPRIKPTPFAAAAMSQMDQAAADNKYRAAELKREQDRVESRASSRLAAAEERHRAVRERLESDRERRQIALQQEADRAQMMCATHDEATSRRIAEMSVGTLDKELEGEEHASRKREAVQRVADTRSQKDQHCARIDSQIQETSSSTNHAIESISIDTGAKLSDLKTQRSEIGNNFRKDVETRECWGQNLISDLTKQADEEVLASETFRHRAAHAVDRAGELGHAARTVAQNKARLNEEKAAAQHAELAQATHQTELECDATVENLLINSKTGIQEAHNRAKLVKAERAKEAAEYQQRMRQIESDAKARAKEVARRVTGLEFERLDGFINNNRNVQEVEETFRSKRDACDGEMDAINRRLREIEEETRARSKQILDSWTQGNRVTEQAVRDLEEKGRCTMEQMQASVKKSLQETGTHKGSVQEDGVSAASSLKRKTNLVIDSTQASLEDARRSDEDATERALAAFRDLRPEAGVIESTADTRVDEAMDKANLEEQRLRQDCEARSENARLTTKAAFDEEQWLVAETAAAWSRIRKACYQLRLINLHDFAQGIVTGTFDVSLPVKDQAQVALM